VETGRVGWVFNALDGDAMRQAARYLIGEHDFSSFRASACQALSPVKTLHRLDITRRSVADSLHREMECCYWRFEFEGSAFLHHMVRNIMGCLVAIGDGSYAPEWMAQVLAARSRDAAAPTFSPHGLYFMGPVYGSEWNLPDRVPGFDWLP
jgi:tRNA pseudouridine38-40 synthase